MNAVAKMTDAFRSIMFARTAEPEAVFGRSREMTGFFATLSAEQKERALAYCGEENHGDEEFRRNS